MTTKRANFVTTKSVPYLSQLVLCRLDSGQYAYFAFKIIVSGEEQTTRDGKGHRRYSTQDLFVLEIR